MTGVDIPVDGGFSVLGPDRGFPRARGSASWRRARTAARTAPERQGPAGDDEVAGLRGRGGRGAERSASPALAGFSG